MTLRDLNIGKKGVVIEIKTSDKALRRRILDMGITTGVTIEKSKVSPLGDPIGIKLRGYELCLRNHELEQIEIEAK